MVHSSHRSNSKVIKGRVISASEIEKKLENPERQAFKLKDWFQCCKFDLIAPFKRCFAEKLKDTKTPSSSPCDSDNQVKKSNKCLDYPNQKLKKMLSQKSTVYCVDQPKFDEFNKSFETDIESSKQDNISTGFELDVNNTLRRTFSNTLNQLRENKTISQQSTSFSVINLIDKDPFSNEITFSNLFGNLDNFLNEDSLEFYSDYDSESDQSYECDNLSYSNSEAFYEQTIVYEYVTRF